MASNNENYEKSFEEFEWLNDYAPCFVIDSNKIEILNEPSQFYNRLKVRENIDIKENITKIFQI